MVTASYRDKGQNGRDKEQILLKFQLDQMIADDHADIQEIRKFQEKNSAFGALMKRLEGK